MTIQKFRNTVWKYYLREGRHDLPWRKTHDPYKILVSEIMLQQTQVERVKSFYKDWLEKFPTVEILAQAPLGDVLRAWQGLGYNRRAKMLHDAAKMVVKEHNGKVPTSPEDLEQLPGVGPYTARAVAAFSANATVVFIETNLRTVVTHYFFPDATEKVKDTDILAILEKAYPKAIEGKSLSREWYAALMDYGAHLKRSGVRINNKSASYTKQSTFAGSDRQARGAILRELAKGPATRVRLLGLLGDNRQDQLAQVLEKLLTEDLVEKRGAKYQLPI